MATKKATKEAPEEALFIRTEDIQYLRNIAKLLRQPLVPALGQTEHGFPRPATAQDAVEFLTTQLQHVAGEINWVLDGVEQGFSVAKMLEQTKSLYNWKGWGSSGCGTKVQLFRERGDCMGIVHKEPLNNPWA